MDDLYRRALDPEWQRVHKQMGFSSPLADLYEALGFYDEEDQNMNISAIHPDGPGIAIEHQATGEQPVNVTPEGIQPAAQRQSGKRKTNGDKWRQMTDREIAEFIVYKLDCQQCPLFDRFFSRVCSIETNNSAQCIEALTDWAAEEAQA